MAQRFRLLCATALVVLLGTTLALWQPAHASAPKPDPLKSKKCMRCHPGYAKKPNILTGDFYSLSRKAKSFQVKVNKRIQVVKFTAETKVKNVPSIKALKRPIPVRVYYKKKGHDLVATRIVAKPVIKVPPEKLMDVKEMERLVALGPEKGDYVLVDARPAIRYKEGHIPGAISVPFPRMLDLKDRLPKDKNKRIIFYCGGFR